MAEEWRKIEWTNGLYEVSSLGRVRSKWGKCGAYKVLKPTIIKNSGGRLKVKIYTEGKSRDYKIHRLVAEAFIPNPENKPEVNHIDGNPSNNNVDNLEWVTRRENIQHSWDTGLRVSKMRAIPDKDLKELYIKQKLGVKRIAQKYGVSGVSVLKRLRFLGVEIRDKSPPVKYDAPKEKIWELIDKGKTNKEIAEELGCTTALVATRKWQYKKGR